MEELCQALNCTPVTHEEWVGRIGNRAHLNRSEISTKDILCRSYLLPPLISRFQSTLFNEIFQILPPSILSLNNSSSRHDPNKSVEGTAVAAFLPALVAFWSGQTSKVWASIDLTEERPLHELSIDARMQFAAMAIKGMGGLGMGTNERGQVGVLVAAAALDMGAFEMGCKALASTFTATQCRLIDEVYITPFTSTPMSQSSAITLAGLHALEEILARVTLSAPYLDIISSPISRTSYRAISHPHSL